MRSSFSAFLKARPSLLLPVPDGWLVALDGAGRGTLATPTHLPQQPTDVVGMVSDAELGLDDLREPLGGPQFRGKTLCARPRFEGAL